MKNKLSTVVSDLPMQAGEKIIAQSRAPTIQAQVSLNQLTSDEAKVLVVRTLAAMEVKRTLYWCVSISISTVISGPIFWYALHQLLR